MSVNRLYHTWFEKIEQMWPALRVTQLRNLVWLMVGIYQSKAVHLREIAMEIPGRAKTPSVVRRLQRFLSNAAIRVRKLYSPFAKRILRACSQHGQIRLIVDGTKVSFSHQLLMVGIGYRKRAIPLVWTWVRKKRGHSSAYKQLALLAHVRALLPANASVLLVGDSEFGSVDVLRQLDDWGWHYVLRQSSTHLIDLTLHNHWHPFGDMASRGRSVWMERAHLTRKHVYPVNLLAHWEPGYKEPWLLATNLPNLAATLRAYRRRMWIEEFFGDVKGHSFNLESTRLRHFLRLSRLTLAVCLLYVWLLFDGAQGIKNGKRHLVDRKDRRDLSLLQIGFGLIKRRLKNGLRLHIRLRPVF
jgi:hypothetical protein